MKMQLFLLALGVLSAMKNDLNEMEDSGEEMDPEMASLMKETKREMEKYKMKKNKIEKLQQIEYDDWIAESEREKPNLEDSTISFRMDGEVGIIYKICQFCDACSLNKLRRCSRILMENMKAKFQKFVNEKTVEMVVKYRNGKDSKPLFMYWNNEIAYKFLGAYYDMIENHCKSLANDRKLRYPNSVQKDMIFGMKIEQVLEDDQTEKFGLFNQKSLRKLLYEDDKAPKQEDQYKTFFGLMGSEQYQEALKDIETKSFVDREYTLQIKTYGGNIGLIVPENQEDKVFVMVVGRKEEDMYKITFENNRLLYSFRLDGNLYVFAYIYSSETNVQTFVYRKESAQNSYDLHIDFFTAGQQVNYKNILRDTRSKKIYQAIRMITDKVFLDVDDIRPIYKKAKEASYLKK